MESLCLSQDTSPGSALTRLQFQSQCCPGQQNVPRSCSHRAAAAPSRPHHRRQERQEPDQVSCDWRRARRVLTSDWTRKPSAGDMKTGCPLGFVRPDLSSRCTWQPNQTKVDVKSGMQGPHSLDKP